MGIQEAGAIVIQPPQDFTKPIPIGLGTHRMSDVSLHARGQSSGGYRISRRDDFLHRLIRSSSSAPPSDTPFDASQKHVEASHEVEVASLQDPAVISCDILDASNAVGNQGHNATLGTSGYIADTPTPSFRRFPFAPEDGTKKDRIISMHTAHRHQIRRPSYAPEAEPQTVNDEEKSAGRDTRRPWGAIQRRERCGVPLAQGGYCPVSTARSARKGLLTPHGMSNTSQSPLPRLSSPSFLPDRPGYSASRTTLPTLTMPMYHRVRTPNFSVSCFHTQRIQDKNKETSLIFLT